jgi:hypothetical protein
MIHYLKFSDSEEYQSLLSEVADDVKSLLTLDEIGTIFQGGEYAEDGTEVSPAVALNGWHVNVLGELPEDWKQYEIQTPNTPTRIFAGY